MFNPVFMVFFVLCVVLYAMLVQPSAEMDLPLVAELLLWSALLMSSLLWLLLSISAIVFLVDRGVLKTIFTLVALVPLILINSYMASFILEQFSMGFDDAYGSRLESVFRNAVVFVCFDILHSRFIAPQHPAFISPERPAQPSAAADVPDRPAIRRAPAEGAPAPAALSRASIVAQAPALAPSPPGFADTAIEAQSICPAIEPTLLEIGNLTLDAESILWIKSEDHYLSVQLLHKSVMLRGKLAEAVKALGNDRGAQINRSVWIAFSAILTIKETAKGVLCVHLSDDTSFRVASTRSIMVQHSFERYLSETQGS